MRKFNNRAKPIAKPLDLPKVLAEIAVHQMVRENNLKSQVNLPKVVSKCFTEHGRSKQTAGPGKPCILWLLDQTLYELRHCNRRNPMEFNRTLER